MKTLTKEELRVRVAELCGWKFYDGKPTFHFGATEVPWGGHGSATGGKRWVKPDGVPIVRWMKTRKDANEWAFQNGLPDYPNDLNAMAKAEEMLTDEQWDAYERKLREICSARSWYEGAGKELLHATAEQRARAFCATMEGAK